MSTDTLSADNGNETIQRGDLVVSIHERQRGILLDQYPYTVTAAENQETVYRSAERSQRAAIEKASDVAERLS